MKRAGIVFSMLLWVSSTIGCVASSAAEEVEQLSARACSCADHRCAAQVRQSLDSLIDTKGRQRLIGGDAERVERAAMSLEVCAMKRGVTVSAATTGIPPSGSARP
jgi:hypothetical protein